MSSRTASQIADRVIDSIGNRSGGTIGARNVQDVILDSINDGISTIMRRMDVSTTEKNATIAITNAAYSYAVPTTDDASATIRVKEILKVRLLKTGETYGWDCIKLSQRRKDQIFPLTLSSYSGRPIYYCQFGSNIEFHPYPDGNYTAYLRVATWLDRITINTQSPLDEEFDDIIEAYATGDIFRRLQLTDDANYWMQIFEQKFNEIRQQTDREADWEPSAEPDPAIGGPITDPALNPFVRRYP